MSFTLLWCYFTHKNGHLNGALLLAEGLVILFWLCKLGSSFDCLRLGEMVFLLLGFLPEFFSSIDSFSFECVKWRVRFLYDLLNFTKCVFICASLRDCIALNPTITTFEIPTHLINRLADHDSESILVLKGWIGFRPDLDSMRICSRSN